eukprot:scaffold706_cov418-Prasinococcus_capsulatus_cf.AAC.40
MRAAAAAMGCAKERLVFRAAHCFGWEGYQVAGQFPGPTEGVQWDIASGAPWAVILSAPGLAVALCLGEATPSYDADTEVVQRADWQHISDDTLQAALQHFIGPIKQVPPMYSALSVGGERLYNKARRVGSGVAARRSNESCGKAPLMG